MAGRMPAIRDRLEACPPSLPQAGILSLPAGAGPVHVCGRERAAAS
jgi:hypothetical protein